jgi:hypothetical protein
MQIIQRWRKEKNLIKIMEVAVLTNGCLIGPRDYG